MLQSMGSQRVGQDWATELNWAVPSDHLDPWISYLQPTFRLLWRSLKHWDEQAPCPDSAGLGRDWHSSWSMSSLGKLVLLAWGHTLRSVSHFEKAQYSWSSSRRWSWPRKMNKVSRTPKKDWASAWPRKGWNEFSGVSEFWSCSVSSIRRASLGIPPDSAPLAWKEALIVWKVFSTGRPGLIALCWA